MTALVGWRTGVKGKTPKPTKREMLAERLAVEKFLTKKEEVNEQVNDSHSR